MASEERQKPASEPGVRDGGGKDSKTPTEALKEIEQSGEAGRKAAAIFSAAVRPDSVKFTPGRSPSGATFGKLTGQARFTSETQQTIVLDESWGDFEVRGYEDFNGTILHETFGIELVSKRPSYRRSGIEVKYSVDFDPLDDHEWGIHKDIVSFIETLRHVSGLVEKPKTSSKQ